MNHTLGELRQKQSLPLEAKIVMTKHRIKEWYDHYDGMVYVSFSGGKDSTVLKHLVEHTDGVYDVPSVFVNTGLEYPEIQRFARNQPNVEVIAPKLKFPDVLKKYGYPVISKEVSCAVYECKGKEGNWAERRYQQLSGCFINKMTGELSPYNMGRYKYLLDADFQISNKCCYVMKKEPSHQYGKKTGRFPMTGMMAEESRLRESSWIRNGCNAFNNGKSMPMAFWNENDVLGYIVKYNVPYCREVYGDIIETGVGTYTTTKAKRTGCMFCMFGCHLEDEPNRFQQMEKTHPHQYLYCIGGGEYDANGKWQPNEKGLGLGHVLDYIGVNYRREKELFDELEEVL